MNKPKIRILPTFPERPTNPARCYVRNGVIEINAARMKELSPFQREYVLLHELGHYNKGTFNEVAADRYALDHLAFSRPYSLRDYLYAVDTISYGNTERVDHAKKDVLVLAAGNGSGKAKELLRSHGIAAADGGENDSKSRTWLVIGAIVAVVLGIWILNKRKHG